MIDQVKYRFCKDCPDYLACGRIYDRRKRRKHCGKATLSSHKIIATNADRIRNMSDGELAQFLMDSFACSLNCPAYDICDAEGACVEFLAKWLQQEADI